LTQKCYSIILSKKEASVGTNLKHNFEREWYRISTNYSQCYGIYSVGFLLTNKRADLQSAQAQTIEVQQHFSTTIILFTPRRKSKKLIFETPSLGTPEVRIFLSKGTVGLSGLDQ
jgi:hypothetical protein